MKIQPVRGTHDIYGNDLLTYKFIQNTISELAQIYDYKEIITPIFENSELFKKPLGENSDVVLKEMYSFKDRNESFLTLRPEYTTPMIRAALTNNLLNKLPVKLFGYGPMFRRERPQKGRFRQFNQINFEIFGVDDQFADVEIIALAENFLNKIIPKNSYKLYLNSLGDKNTLLKFKSELTNYFDKYKKNFSEELKDKIKSNPLRILDSKNEENKDLISSAPKINQFYSKVASKKFDEVQELLLNSNIDFEIDPNLVRGLDYYCDSVFEFKSDSLGSQSTIIGGGRYDGLIKMLGGPDIPGCGWASGVERLMMLCKIIQPKMSFLHVIILEDKYKNYGFNLINILRNKNINTSFNYKYDLKKSLSKANASNAKYAIIIGEDEINEKVYTLKNLKDGEQKKLTIEEILNFFNI
tara:strand:+ start:137 stop:1372 length:1236 start_codon:yes stop_codon:yes gene_type:complete